MKRITAFSLLFLIAYTSTFFKIEAQSVVEWNEKSYSSTFENGQTFSYPEYLPEGYRDNNTAYTSDVALSSYIPENDNNDIAGWLLSYTNTKLRKPASTLTVDLGEDYFTVPAYTSTTITSIVTGNVVSYNWTQISGPNTATLGGQNTTTLKASNLMVDQTYVSQSRPEGYIFRLTVTDNLGNTAYDEINVKLITPYLGANIKPYTYTKKITGWDTSPYLSYNYDLPFRILYPRDYKSREDGKKYPLILVIHGRVEGGTDNDYQLKNGGKIHLDAVMNGKFEGFVVFPQYNRSNGFPASADLDNMTKIVNELIIREKVDPNRVHVHGLSSGGQGTWDMIVRHPKVYASAMPMAWSAEKYRYPDNLKKYIHLPLWVSQGGKDAVSPPERANDLVKKIRAEGANVRYLYFPNHGHNVWDDTHKQAGFFPFFMERNKTDIHVFYGQTAFCEDDDINVKLGLTAGFEGYEWQKDGVTINTGVNEITVTGEGYYRARFMRGSIWTAWSQPVHISRQRDSSPTPVVTSRKKSTHLPSLDGNEEVTLYATEGYAQYFWFKNGQLIENSNKPILTVSEAGSYTVTATEPDPVPNTVIPDEYKVEPARCESLPSTPIIVTIQNGPSAPKAPTNLFAYIRSETSIELKFEDHATNEKGFEIYRSNQSGGPYTIIDIIPANGASNPAAYVDSNLKGETTYFYKIRAVNDDGASTYSNEAKATTPIDNQPPSVPQNLRVVHTTPSTIALKWEASTDNVGITEYLIYQDGNLIATSQSPEYIASGLSAGSVHTYTVRVKDAVGHISSPSNQVAGAAVYTGLAYTYYHVSGIGTVNDIETKGTLIKKGRINNFLLTPRQQETDYAFIYEGFIYIETEGSYTFFLKSDDGSHLYVDNQLVVNNDGPHGCSEKSGAITLTPGTYPIKVDFFQAGGGACLEVRWSASHISKQLIPDQVLREAFDFLDGPPAPTNLQVTAISHKKINVSWQDQSNDETGFEIYRATQAGGPFSIIHTTEADAITYADTTLIGNTTYYYKIRAINAKGASPYTEVKSAKTLATPAAPAKPTNLAATATSSSSIRLDWTDASTNETGFEIWRTTSPSGNGFALLQTVAANEISYQDLSLPGNTALYYKIRAKGDGNYSDYTAVVTATTSNNEPVLQNILSRTVKFNTTQSFDILVTDPDINDVVSFEVKDLPAFGSFVNNNDNTGTFTFSPGNSDGGSYDLQVKALDNYGGASIKSFTITVNNNATPVIQAIENQQISQGTSLTINVNASDEDGNDSLQLSLINHPDFATITDSGNGKGVITIKPDINETPGDFANIQVIAKDQQGGVGVYSFDLIVKGIDKEFTVYINFSHGNLASFPWNNTGGAKDENNILGNMTDEEGKKTGMSLKLRQDGGPSWFSIRTTTDSDLYNADVRDTRYSSYSTPAIIMTMRGLNPLLNYNFTFFGSSNEPDIENRTRITRYTIGNKSGEVETFNNVNTTVNLTNIRSDENGNVEITVSKKTSNDWIMVLNAMVVEGFYDNGGVPSAPSHLSAQALSPSEVQLVWLDNAKNEEGFEILRSTNSNGPFEVIATTQSNTVSYKDEGLSGRVTYFYKVKAFNNHGKSAESNVATVITPNNAPVLDVPAYVAVEVGSTQKISIKATDAENDPLLLYAENLPSFANFIDHGDGTATLMITPVSLKNIGTYSTKITAIDDRNDSDERGLIVMVISNEYEETVYINFGNDNTAGVPWNNTNRGPVSSQSYANLKNMHGNTSPVSFTVLDGWSSVENFGVNTNNNAGIYPDAVIKSYWKTSSSAGLKFSGLSSDKIYNFIFFASNDTIAEGTTTFTIGNTTTSLNAAYNSQQAAYLNGIVPDSNGEVTVTLGKGPYSMGAFLGALVLQAYDEQALPSPSHLTARAVSRTQIKLNWTDHAGNETGYNIYRSDSPTGSYSLIATLSSSVTTYMDNNLTKNTTYYYKVQAVKDALVSEYTNVAAATSFEYVIYINFVGNNSKYTYPGAPWNNTKTSPSVGGTFKNLKDDSETSRAIQIYVDEWADGSDNDLGINTGNNSGIYPDGVLKSFYYLESNAIAKLEVQQLDRNYQYSFIFFGSGDPNIDLFKSAGNLTTDYTVGQTTVSLNALGNTNETVQINGIVPDANNTAPLEIISHRFHPKYSANYAIVNAMVIGAYTPSEVIIDELAPTTPTNLAASHIAPTSVTLAWNHSTDNSGTIASYEIYDGNQLVTVVNGNTNIRTITNTVSDITYNFSIVAVDEAGNKSPASEILTFSYEVLNGINYAYYEGVWNAMPDYAALNPIKTGFADHFSLAPKVRSHDFGFLYQGYIKITDAGDYTFYTKSNTGSRLYIDGIEIVNNDVANNSAEKSGTAAGLTSGWHEIILDYRNAQETDLLDVRYEGPGVSKMVIPNSVLFRTAIVDPVGQPVEFVQVKAELISQEVILSWSTASEINNDYFTIEKSYDLDNFISIGQVEGAGNSTEMKYYTFTDNRLRPGNMYYRIRQTDFDGNQKYSKVVFLNADAIFKLTDAILFPNPTLRNNINLKVTSSDYDNPVHISVVDLMGRIVFEDSYASDELFEGKKIEPQYELRAGTYVVKLEQGNQVIYCRVIIQE